MKTQYSNLNKKYKHRSKQVELLTMNGIIKEL